MTPAALFLLFAIGGFILLAAEILVPGLILGTAGTLCLVGSIVVAYLAWGGLIGSIALIGLTFAYFAGIISWLNLMPRTKVGRQFMLQRTLMKGRGDVSFSSLVGQEGVALTPLRPSGTASIDQRRVDVIAEGELIESGASVLVVREEGSKIVVRKIPVA